MKVFKEAQKFTQVWVILLFLLLNSFFLYGIYQQFILKIPFGDNPMPNSVLILSTVGFIALTLFFFSMKLKTTINETGIYYQFYPIQLKAKKINWSALKYASIVTFNPILDYGGWGIKHNSYTVKGRIGIQLVLKSGKKLLIGTQKEQNAIRILKTYQKKMK